MTLNEIFVQSARRTPDRPMLSVKSDKSWITHTYKDIADNVDSLGRALRGRGIVAGDRVAILSENRPEWLIVDFASLSFGAVTVPVYPSLPPNQIQPILADSGAKAVFVSDVTQIAKIDALTASLPSLSLVVLMGQSSANAAHVRFDDLLREGRDFGASESNSGIGTNITDESLASLVYTSGTTGIPKGTMLSHANFTSEIRNVITNLPLGLNGEVFLSFLPLCHIYERVTCYAAISLSAHIFFCESVFKVQPNMQEVKPDLMQSVPRLFESIHDRVLDMVSKWPQKRQVLFRKALAIGLDYSMSTHHGKQPGIGLRIKHVLADKLVLRKIRERLGGRLRFLVSGGAPLRRETAEFFEGIGVPILEGYGLTETTAAVTINPYGRNRIGTVGPPLKGVSVRIADDGEILAKGPTVMLGYWNKPVETAEVIDSDGWFHTGDIGTLDAEGYLKVTDRKKDIIVLANGKNVAPQPIEHALLRSSMLHEVVLLGDDSGTIGALVYPNYDKLRVALGTEQASQKEIASSLGAKKLVKKEIDRLSEGLADFERVRKVALLSEPLSIERGELTPTLKVRRRAVQERYGNLLA
jgi:long-chain acyl-CoA synthetase